MYSSVFANNPETPMHLMSLWGGFNDCSNDNSGPEKRLEMDFDPHRGDRDASLAQLLDPQTWCPILEQLGCHVAKAQVDADSLSIVSPDAMMVLNREKIVLTTCATLELHTAVAPLLATCTAVGVVVEWASYSRKNTTSPWQRDSDQSMALEYSVLKDSFPSGRPFLIGPLDSDHFFYFVFDRIQRPMNAAPTVVEEDVQVNLLMYGAHYDEATVLPQVASALGAELNDPAFNYCESRKGDAVTAVRVLNGAHFETMRVSNGKLGRVISFETNVNAESTFRSHMLRLVELFSPERFSVVILLDPQSAPAMAPMAAPLQFSNYSRLNRATTEFECGKTVSKFNFVRSD